MKKIIVFLTVSAMLLTFTQCRKPVLLSYGDYQVQTITFTANGNSSEKVTIDNDVPDEMNFKWEENDKIYVYGSSSGDFNVDGEFCGWLFLSSGAGQQSALFMGDVKIPSGENARFRFFYFAGGVTETVTDGKVTDARAEINIASQNGSLEGDNSLQKKVVAMCDDVKVGGNKYSGKLKLQMAVLKFDLSAFGTKHGNNVTMSGTNTKISVTNRGVIEKNTADDVTLNEVRTDSEKYYVAVLPNLESLNFSGNGVTGVMSYAINENKFYHALEGASIKMPTTWNATVSTDNVFDIHARCASCRGTVTSGTGIAEQGVCWVVASAGHDPTINDNKFVVLPESSGNTFNGLMDNLTNGANYKARAYIKNGEHVKYGDVKTFTTLNTDPTFSTVNFGVPNLKWAKSNLGATNSSEASSWYGDYYQWGDVSNCNDLSIKCDWYHCRYIVFPYVTKYCQSDQTGSWYDYTPGVNEPDGKTELELADDCVNKIYGGGWRMPSSNEWVNLYNNNTFVWVQAGNTNNDVNPAFKAVVSGMLVIKGGKNGRALDNTTYMFLPFSGGHLESNIVNRGTAGYYWSRTLMSPTYSAYFNFDGNGVYNGGSSSNCRYCGFSIRPVCSQTKY